MRKFTGIKAAAGESKNLMALTEDCRSIMILKKIEYGLTISRITIVGRNIITKT